MDTVNNEKLLFLKRDFLPLITQLGEATQARWGKMNAQQMVEHFSETLRYANGKTVLVTVTPEEYLPKLRTFMLSEKPFRENTKSSMLGEEPLPVVNKSLESAREELKNELTEFFVLFDANPETETQNPVFGKLTFAENIHLLHKHAMHHLKQFGLIE